MRELLRRIGESARRGFQEGQLAGRKQLKRPITPLERSTVTPLAREIVDEANNLLGHDDETSRFVSDFKMIKITGRKEARTHSNLSNTDLAIQVLRYKGKFDTYVFYPNGVHKYTTRATINNKKPEQVAKGEASLGDLTKLLKDIRASKPQI